MLEPQLVLFWRVFVLPRVESVHLSPKLYVALQLGEELIS